MNPTRSNNTSCRNPFDGTLDALLSGEVSARDNILLNDALRADPAARRAYIRSMAFEAMLAQEFAPLEALPAPEPARRRRWLAPLAIAATILLAATLAWQIQLDTVPSGLAENPLDLNGEMSHAVITGFDDASGRFGHVALSQGMRLTEGLVELNEGLVEITFDSGAEVTLEGPARLQLESGNQALLSSGRASARVPQQARGFVIHTPSSYIRDLGTAFAVEVRDDRETDLHVLEGEVEVAATDPHAVNPTQVLHQREAVRLVGGGMHPISFRADNPGERRKKRTPKIPPSVHWSFDSWDGDTTTDATSGHSLKLLQKKGQATPETLDGPFGLALHFNGKGSFARSDYPGVGGTQPRTVACWLRLQPGEPRTPTKPNGIIAWSVKRSSGKWQLAWNQAYGQGTVGALRVEFGGGYVIGATDLRDGRWHHLAVVYLGGHKVDISTHVRLYVDGRLESITGRQPRRIDTAGTSSATRPLMLGRNLGRGPGGEAFSFEGDLDEVHVFEGSLLPGQIERLMKRNSIRQPKL